MSALYRTQTLLVSSSPGCRVTLWSQVHTVGMTNYDEAVVVQRRHEDRLLALPGVSGVGVRLRDDRPVLVVTFDADADLPDDLRVPDIDGVELQVDRGRYQPQ